MLNTFLSKNYCFKDSRMYSNFFTRGFRSKQKIVYNFETNLRLIFRLVYVRTSFHVSTSTISKG